MSFHDNVLKKETKKQKKGGCTDNPPSEVNPCPRYTVNITLTEQTGGAAYPEANLNTKIGRKIVGDSGASIFNCRPLHTRKIRWCPRSRQKAQTDTRVCRSIRHRETCLLCRCIATQKVSAVSGRVKREEHNDDGRMDARTDGIPPSSSGGEGRRKGKKKCSMQTRQRLSPTEAVSKLVKQRS